MTLHYHEIDDAKGDLSELVAFCCDSCHQEWCHINGYDYGGWNGCHGSDVNEYCRNCGVIANCGSEDDYCEHQADNIVVNRFLSEDGERCKHGNWIQLPVSHINS